MRSVIRWVMLAALLASLAALGRATSAAAASPPIEIGYLPAQPISIVEVSIPPGAQEATVTLFLHNAGAADLTTIPLYAVLLNQGVPLPTGKLDFLDPSQNDAPLPALDLKHDSSWRRVALRVSSFTLTGTYTGSIGVQMPEGSVELAPLRVVRVAQADVVVQEAKDDTVTLYARGLDLNASFFVVEKSGQTTTQTVTLVPGPLHDENDQTLAPKVTPGPFSLASGGAQQMSLSGQLPEIGAFKGLLVLQFGTQQHTYTLQVLPDPAPAQVQIRAIAAPPLLRWWPGQEVTAEVPIVLHETGGRRATLYPPTLQQLVRTADQTGTPHHWSLRDAHGTVLVSDKEQGAAGAQAPAAERALTLPPNGSLPLTLEITGLKSAGQAQGTVDLAAPAGSATTQTFILALKDDWPLPLLCLLAGVGLAFYSRQWTLFGRSNALKERLIAIVHREIDAALPAGDPLLPAFDQQLDDLKSGIRMGAATDVEAELTRLRAKKDNYLIVRDVLQLEEDLPQLLADEASQQRFAASFADLRAQVAEWGLAGLTGNGQQEARLVTEARALRDKLMDVAQQRLSASIEALDDSLTRLAANTTRGPLVGDATLADLQRNVAALKSQLPAAKGAPADAALLGLNRLIASYNTYAAQLTGFQVRLFEQALAAQSGPPIGFSKDDWNKASKRWLERLSPATYEAVRRDYLATILRSLRDAATGVVDDTAQPAAVRDAAASIAQQASNALFLVGTLPDSAQATYGELQREFRARVLKIDTGGTREYDVPPGPAVLTVQAGSPSPQLPRLSSTHRSPEQDLQAITRRVSFNNRLVSLITLIVAVIVGMQLQWAGNAGFGLWLDYINIFLWGFGLSKLTDAAVSGTLTQLRLGLPADDRAGG